MLHHASPLHSPPSPSPIETQLRLFDESLIIFCPYRESFFPVLHNISYVLEHDCMNPPMATKKRVSLLSLRHPSLRNQAAALVYLFSSACACCLRVPSASESRVLAAKKHRIQMRIWQFGIAFHDGRFEKAPERNTSVCSAQSSLS